MISDDQLLIFDRAELLRSFSQRADEAKVELRPQGSERDMNLCGRTYWEVGSDRVFTVALTSNVNARIDVFTKRTGVDDEAELLYATVPPGRQNDEMLWKLYVGWMHDRLEWSALESLLA